MAEDDSIEVRAKLGRLDAAIEQASARLQESIARAEALGDETLASRLRIQQEALKTPAAGVRETPQIEQDTSALKRENAVRQEGLQVELFKLDALERESRVLVEQDALISRLQARQATRAAQLPLFEEPISGAVHGPQIPHGPPPTVTPAGYVPSEEQVRQARLRAAIEEEFNQQLVNETAARERALTIEREQLALDRERAAEAQRQYALLDQLALGSRAGQRAGEAGRLVPAEARKKLMNPDIEGWGAAERGAQRYIVALGEYNALGARAGASTAELNANVTRLGIAENEASDALRRHGALTTEYLTALARGETTVAEFGYQIGATIGKFAGWTAAAAATYGAIGVVAEFGRGAIDASSGVQQLTRTIDNLDTSAASSAIQKLSADTNVSVKEASDAIFQYSRVFHNVNDAATAAGQGLSVLKLDNVSLADSVALSTGIHQQWGRTAAELAPIWNMLAAGQREYNARISQTTTILRGAQAAVKNAGGDLNQLVQLSVLGAQALPGQPGQIATALSRSAATYARQNLPILQTEFGLGRGMNASTYDFTELFQEAIRLSGSLDQQGRARLATLFFDPRLAARQGAAFFSPQAATTLASEQRGPRAITPGATQGALQEELGRELGTFRERMHSFTNEIQRAGAALGSSGIVNLFSGLISGAVGVGGAFRGVVDTFDALPNVVKEGTEALVAFRVAMLFLNRTRFGGSVAELTRLNRIPGIGASEATQARGELRVGTRTALDTVGQDLTRTNTRLVANAAQQAELEARRQVIERQIAEEKATTGKVEAQTLERSNALSAQIAALDRKQTELEIERNAQLEVQASLKAQSVGLSSTNRNKRFTDAEVLALNAEVNASTQRTAEQTGATDAETSTTARLAAQKERLAAATRANSNASRAAAAAASASAATAGANTAASAGEQVGVSEDAAAQGFFARMQARLALAFGALAAEETAGAAAASAAAVGAGEAVVATGGLGASLGGLAAALDPLLLLLIAVPFAASEVKSQFDAMNKASEQAKAALRLDRGGDAAQNLTALANAYQQAREHEQTAGLRGAGRFVAKTFFGVPLAPATGANALSDATRDLARHESDYAQQFARDAQGLMATNAGRAQLAREAQQLEAAVRAGASTALAGHPQMIAAAISQFDAWISQMTEAARLAHAHSAPSQLDFLAGLSDQGLQKWSQAYSDRSDIFGLDKNDLSGAIGSYLTMAARYRDSSDPTQLQALKTAQTAVAQAVNKQVTGLIDASKVAGSYGGAMGDLSKASSGVNAARQQIAHWVSLMAKTWGNVPGVMKAVNEAASLAYEQLDSFVNNILSQRLTDIQTQTALATSQIQGISPQADVARAQSDLGGLQKQLGAAQQAHDWQKVADLQTQINNSTRDIFKQQTDDAKSIADAQGKLALSQITGISPEADLQRAAQEVENARRTLAASQGLGEAAIANAQADLNDKLNALHKAQLDYANSIAQAYEQLAVASITGISPADDLARAGKAVDNARADLARHIAEGRGQAQRIQDQAALDDAQRAYNQQVQQYAQQVAQDASNFISAQSELAQSQTTDPVTQARDQLAADIKILSTIRPQDYKTYQEYQAAYMQQQAKINKERLGVTQQLVDTNMRTLDFELHTQQISDQQYINGLEQLLKLKNLSLATRQQIQQQIFDVEHQTAVNLNTDNIRLPTTYEVRRAIAATRRIGGRIPQNTGTVINHHTVNHVSIAVRVDRNADVRPFAEALDNTLKSNFIGQAQAAGLI